jgi:hypothetical protein
MLACLKAVAQRIHELKKLRAQTTRDGGETYKLDCELHALQFGAWVLNKSREDERKDEKPWLNGYRTGRAHKGELFL